MLQGVVGLMVGCVMIRGVFDSYSTLFLMVGTLMVALLHCFGGYYAIRICNGTYTHRHHDDELEGRYRVCVSEDCDYELLSRLISKAMGIYTILCYVYGVGLMTCFWLFLFMILSVEDGFVPMFLMIYLVLVVPPAAFIGYLPYHCKTLLSSLCETINQTYHPAS